jgi:hypothetical protein
MNRKRPAPRPPGDENLDRRMSNHQCAGEIVAEGTRLALIARQGAGLRAWPHTQERDDSDG